MEYIKYKKISTRPIISASTPPFFLWLYIKYIIKTGFQILCGDTFNPNAL
jgi:hypothetical protein